MPSTDVTPAVSRVASGSWLLCLSAVGLIAAGCGTATPPPVSEPIGDLPPPTPKQIVVLHSNDNWGETEPCG